MGDKLIVKKGAEKLPEPPKFDAEDLPPPPDFSEMGEPPVSSSVETFPGAENSETIEEAAGLPELPKAEDSPLPQDMVFGALPKKEKASPDKILDNIVEKSSGLFSKIFRKKSKDAQASLPGLNLEAPPSFDVPGSSASGEEPGWMEEGKKFREEEMAAEGESFRENEMEEEGESYLAKTTPLTEVKGIGPKIEKKLKKAGIKSAEHLAAHDHVHIAKKAKIPISQAKKIVSHAKKITSSKAQRRESISDIIKGLEEEKKTLESAKDSEFRGEKIVDLEGHNEVVQVLERLESKRNELLNMQKKLEEKEKKLQGHDDVYRRDMDYVDKMKRNVDHDIRERTGHLIELEREYFQKAQTLAKERAEIEVLSKKLDEKEKTLKDKENELKKELNDLEDREITVSTKEKKFQKIMEEIEKHNHILKEKEDDLEKREAEYMKKLDILENHERNILKNLENKRVSLEKKEKEVKLREEQIYKRQRNVDKKSVAVEYAKNIIEEEKGKLVDDEFSHYVHDQVNRPGSGVNYSDVKLMNSLNVADVEKGTKSIYQLADEIKRMLGSNRVEEAKIYYNQLRERYYDTKFSNQQEQEAVHNLIRTLYDDINLADIGRR
ncbi:TPA: hypothetical protein HA239_06170 [Candidatus Woesearchaeota archaeon]|nr:hypothetical protein QT06_C0001G1334 [archaeon GW2011_AR15]MBS3104209.1 hypothetical protein [Candidatus Woesearchaeota archaeon]HIH41961.1 hypothetical protein [Candidatus Woesearchaeota archaeon]